MHVQMSDNRETMSGAENSWLPVDVDNKEILCDDKRGLCAFHVSDDMETMSDAETSCLPDDAVFHVDVSDNKERLCDEKSYLRACLHER